VRLPSNLRSGLIALGVVIIVGALGFMLFGGLVFDDALYATFTTITTVGYGEVGGPYTGMTRVWVVLVVLGGLGAVLYTATAVIEYGVETVLGSDHRRRRKMAKEIDRIQGHVIVCGFGRVGSTAWKALVRDQIPAVVIERDPEVAERAVALGALVVEGDATTDDVLREAGVTTARSAIAAVASASDNLVITLSVRALHPDLLVTARAVDLETENKLILAGASAVVTPELVGGERMAAMASEPGLADFLDAVVHTSSIEFRIKRFEVGEHSTFVGRTLADLDLRKDSGAMVIGVAKRDESVRINPDPGLPFSVGDVVFGLGSDEDLERLERIIAGT
jgi:voltage-gated potassium channel